MTRFEQRVVLEEIVVLFQSRSITTDWRRKLGLGVITGSEESSKNGGTGSSTQDTRTRQRTGLVLDRSRKRLLVEVIEVPVLASLPGGYPPCWVVDQQPLSSKESQNRETNASIVATNGLNTDDYKPTLQVDQFVGLKTWKKNKDRSLTYSYTFSSVHKVSCDQGFLIWSWSVILPRIWSIDYRRDNGRFWLSAHNCQVATPTSQNLELEQQIRIFGAD